MVQNNAHIGETREQRLKRFQVGQPVEVVATVLNSIANFFINEIRDVFVNPGKYQTSLMFLGTHSIALTISYGLFGKDRVDGYRLFLERFVDGDTPDTKFSTVASEIHEWRNVIAHRWINVAGHSFGYDFDMPEGWKREGEFLIVNPRIYQEAFLRAFGASGKVYQYKNIFTNPEEWEAAKKRFISKYIDGA